MINFLLVTVIACIYLICYIHFVKESKIEKLEEENGALKDRVLSLRGQLTIEKDKNIGLRRQICEIRKENT